MMKGRALYIFVPLTVIATAVLGSVWSSAGMPWYQTVLIRPDITPPDWAFPVAWNTIFILGIISAIKGIQQSPDRLRRKVIALFLLNALLNAGWSFLFFGLHAVTVAFIEMIVLEGTILGLMILLWKHAKVAALLLAPYLLWVGFATYLTWQIVLLNP